MEVEKQVFREGIWEAEAPAEPHSQAPIENYKLVEFGSPLPNVGEGLGVRGASTPLRAYSLGSHLIGTLSSFDFELNRVAGHLAFVLDRHFISAKVPHN
jgi:hypothetical protein